jgi:hypothetical protein
MTTPDNLDQDQKRGDHLTVALSLAAILLVHILIPILFPEYGYSYHNTVFDIGVGVLFIGYLLIASKLWSMTFETYNGWYVAGPVLMAVAGIIWFMSWGAVHGTAVLNGFTK